MTRYEEILKKLKTLSEQGVGGEKDNAKTMLEKLMKKYGMTLEDLEMLEENFETFKFHPAARGLFIQVALSVCGIGLKVRKGTSKRRASIILLVTPAQKLEIQAKFNFYSRSYSEHLQVFNSAFYHKNGLFAHDAPASDKPVDMERVAKIFQMMSGIEQADYLKQLK